MKILCVAEKPSIAKSISEILSSGNGLQNRPGRDQFCRNFCFRYRMPPGQSIGRHRANGWVDMVVTSVRGHLMSNDFGDEYRKWKSCSPTALFEAPIMSFVSEDCKKVAQNLKDEARSSDVLMIWTDCDREGEHIGAEVVRECQRVKRDIEVTRARFSAIIANQIHHAAQNPVALDWAAANAVEARIELDLRIGSAFTRMQTLTLQDHFQELDKKIISYGPCQFPTLGFVVDQYIKHSEFVPEPFWYIHVMHRKARIDVTFHWARKHLFVQAEVKRIFDRCKSDPEATVIKVTSKQTRKFKPRPLTTVELQKSGGRLLHMAPKRILDVAEKLYQRGFLSYPRTETDQYDAQFDFKTLVGKQRSDSDWGRFASQLLDDQGAFDKPRNGQKNDKAHPPIHPTAHANGLTGDDKKVYDYVTRRFLASCSKDAIGEETKIDLKIADELFTATGIVVQVRNFLDVFPYETWGGPGLPQFEEGERFVPTELTMKEGETTRPKLLTEADLVSLMDKNGIGTDATIAEHIAKIIEREYVMAQMEGRIKYLVPSTLGMGLVMGYNDINFAGNKSLCKPLLRRETEEAMTKVCEGETTKAQMVQQSLQEYRAVYTQANGSIERVILQMARYLRGEEPPAPPEWAAAAASSTANDPRQDDSLSLDDDLEMIDDEDLWNVLDGVQTGGETSAPGPNDDARRTRLGGGNHGVSGTSSAPSNSANAQIEVIEIDDDDDDVPVPSHAPAAGPCQQRLRTQTFHPGPSTSFADRVQERESADAHAPMCRCGQAAVQKKVIKESANKGRMFWRCPKQQGDETDCGFFEWCDEAATSGARDPPYTRPSGSLDESNARGLTDSTMDRYRSIMNASSTLASNEVQCECGQEAKRNQVFKDGPNKGRFFYTCPKLSGRTRCKFFAWADEGTDAGQQQQQQQQRVAQGPTGDLAGQSCFNCGEEGHWASACRQPKSDGATGSSRAASFGGNGGGGGSSRSARGGPSGTVSGTCFNCGEEGHWASNCSAHAASAGPSVAPSRKRGAGGGVRNSHAVDVDMYNNDNSEDEGLHYDDRGGTGGRSKRVGTCFNCGQEGHWSSECSEARQEGAARPFTSRGARRGRTTRGGPRKRGRGSSRGSSSL